jgi:hypothetical protein
MRGAIALLFLLLGLGVHGAVVAWDPQRYLALARGALIPFYRDLAVAVVQVSPRHFGLGLLACEVLVALLIIGSGTAVKVGLGAGIVFLVGLTPLGVEVLPNALLAVGLVHLLRQDYPLSALGELRQWRRARAAGVTGDPAARPAPAGYRRSR